jgi:phage terminase large subunit
VSGIAERQRQVEFVRKRLPLWRKDPVLFAREVLGIEPWDDPTGNDSQASFMRAVPGHRRIAWRSGHKVGKSTAFACIALWAFVCFDGARVVFTAPTGRQIEEVTWREVCRLYALAARRGFFLGGRVYDTWSKGIRGPMGRQIFGIATNDQDRFSGISGAHVFYLVDEGSGVEDPIWEAINGNSAGGAWVITAGNPTRNEGAFFRAFHEEADLWKTMHTSSEWSPNVGELPQAEYIAPEQLREAQLEDLQGTDVPGLASRSWVLEHRLKWHPHETHPLYMIRVRGDFPQQGTENVVSLQHLDAAIERWRNGHDDPETRHRMHVGLDCARFGDDANVITIVRGDRVVAQHAFGGMDSIQVAGHVRRLVNDARTHLERVGVREKPLIKVDVIGIGAGVYDQLASFDDLEVVGVNVALPPDSEEDSYSNLRTQLWFGVAQWLARGGQCIPDPTLKVELLTTRYRFDTRGRLQVEPKDDIKERLGRSTDRADSLCLAVYAAASYDPAPFSIAGL